MLHKHAYLYEELGWFDATNGKSLTMVHPNQHRGINCRFGMKGVIAEAHYDSHNNFIALMGGQRRYVSYVYVLYHCSSTTTCVCWTGRGSVLSWRRCWPLVRSAVIRILTRATQLISLSPVVLKGISWPIRTNARIWNSIRSAIRALDTPALTGATPTTTGETVNGRLRKPK